MNIERFIKLRPQLYHLTDKRNLDSILESKTLNSTANLVSLVKMPDASTFLRTRRVGHQDISDGKRTIILRDQDPLSEKIASKNFEPGITFADFVYILNSRVFFWPTKGDLIKHYKRYENQNESPIILRLETAELFKINHHKPKFCRLNSGAPRSSSYHPEGAPQRGNNTFQFAEDYQRNLSTVREVTFEGYCKLPAQVSIAYSLTENFKPI